MPRTRPFLVPVAAVAATGLIAVSAPSALADTAGPAGACAAIGGTGASGPGSSGGSSSRTGAGSSAPMLRGTPGISLPVLDGPTQALQLLTGPGSPQRTDRQWGVAGTDLGIAFTGADGETFLAFGDTVACDGTATDWRSNVLLRTGDSDYADGLDVDQALARDGWTDQRAKAVEFIPSLKIPGVEHTVIPTSGVAVGDDLYVDYMSVRSWGAPGDWSTNYAATVRSEDDGETWELVPESVRVNGDTNVAARVIDALPLPADLAAVRPGNDNLQMTALAHGDDGFLYRVSTPSGRFGDAVLSRVEAEAFPDESAFTFWDGAKWREDAADAVPVIDGPVSELSLSYNDYLDQWVALYMVEGAGVVMRTADELTGDWSRQRMLVDVDTVPDLYGAFVLPHNDGPHLYYVATTWSDYNVMLMRTDLEESGSARSLRSVRDTTVDDGTEVVDVIDYSDRVSAQDRIAVPASPAADDADQLLDLLP